MDGEIDFGDHLSWESYCESLPGPLPFGEDADPEKRALAFALLKAANEHFGMLHLVTLSEGAKREIMDGTHPSQSADRAAEVEEMAKDFQAQLDESAGPISPEVQLGQYQNELLILHVVFDSEDPWSAIDRQIPAYYEGFKVKRTRRSELG